MEIAFTIATVLLRLFTKIRGILNDTAELRLEIEHIKNKLNNHTQNIELVFQYLDELIEKKENPKSRKKIGYLVRN